MSASTEVRYFLLTDLGTQWFTKLAKLTYEITWVSQRRGADLRVETIVQEDVVDLPSEVKGPFLSNIYARGTVPTITLGGTMYSGWSLSPKEHERVKSLINLTPYVNTYNKLIAYD